MDRKKQGVFTRFATKTSAVLGHAWVFALAVLVLVGWAVTGPFLKFNNSWQLVINTGTTIVTFLMVFIIQNTQNRDNMAMNIKLDALLKASNVDDKKLLGLEDEIDEDLEREKADEQAEGGQPNR